MSSVPQIGSALKAPSLNRRLAALVAARWPLAGGRRGQAPDPQRLAFRAVLGVAAVSHGYAVNLQYLYHGTQPEPYIVEGFITGYADGPLTGESYARSCTCPDFLKRRGPARDDLRGEERCCKHMILFGLLASLWRGRLPWGIALPDAPEAPAVPEPARRAVVQGEVQETAIQAATAPGRVSNYRPGSGAEKTRRKHGGE